MVELLLRVGAVLAAFLILPLVVGQLEHKVMAHMQGRLGPMYAGGFHGWAQLVADGVKFLQKEDLTPQAADRWIYRLAPGFALVPYLLAFSAVPLAPRVWAVNAEAGVLLILAALALTIMGTLMAGWSSGNKYALLGGLRSVAQLMSYEVPFVLATCSVVLAAGSLRLTDIVENWQPWWLLWQFPGMCCFVIAGLAELARPPFDMPVADSEIVFGPYTEYSGIRFAFFLLAEYAGIVLLSALTAVLFLGGWRGVPGVAGSALLSLVTFAKAGLVAFVIIWLRVSWPRLRTDQLQALAWKVLVPLALLQFAVTAVVKAF